MAFHPYQLSNIADMFEALAETDLNTTPNARFILDVREAFVDLAGDRYSAGFIDQVVSSLDVSLSKYDAENPDFKRIVRAIAKTLFNACEFFCGNVQEPLAYLKKFTVTLKDS